MAWHLRSCTAFRWRVENLVETHRTRNLVARFVIFCCVCFFDIDSSFDSPSCQLNHGWLNPTDFNGISLWNQDRWPIAKLFVQYVFGTLIVFYVSNQHPCHKCFNLGRSDSQQAPSKNFSYCFRWYPSLKLRVFRVGPRGRNRGNHTTKLGHLRLWLSLRLRRHLHHHAKPWLCGSQIGSSVRSRERWVLEQFIYWLLLVCASFQFWSILEIFLGNSWKIPDVKSIRYPFNPLTWTPQLKRKRKTKMDPWKWKFLFETRVFSGFYVKLWIVYSRSSACCISPSR